LRVNDFIKNKICIPGPATIHENGKTILVGVTSKGRAHGLLNSLFGKPCGPGVNNGLGLYLDTHSSDYVDVYSYVDWIKKTMGDYHIILFPL
jgi:hypothetical protein